MYSIPISLELAQKVRGVLMRANQLDLAEELNKNINLSLAAEFEENELLTDIEIKHIN